MKIKVSILTAVVLFAILIAFDSFVYLTLSRHLIQLEAGVFASKVQTIAQTLRHPDDPEPLDTLDPRLQTELVRYSSDDQSIVVVDSARKILAESGSVPYRDIVAQFTPADEPMQSTIRTDDTTRMYSTAPILRGEGGLVMGYVLLVSNLHSVRVYMQTLLTLLSFGSLGAVLLAALGGYLISATAVRPLVQMIGLVERIQVDNLDERLTVPRQRDEIARLAATFNRMLTRIQRSFQQQSRFVADASHEIRTPLTTIQGYAALLDRWGKDDPEVLQKSIQVIQKESARLRDLADDLLTLASIESTSDDLPKHCPVNVTVDEVIDLSTLLHAELTVERSLGVVAEAAIAPIHLKRILTNIVDNAIKYTPADGTLVVTTRMMDAWIEITIADSGQGIAEEELPFIFDRFYRVDKARTRRAGGSGLGLAIVKELVELYGGTITIQSIQDQGTTVIIHLPAAA